MHIAMNYIGRHIGTRFAGADLRSKILSALNKGETIILDFEGVQSLSDPFAEECFGKLMELHELNFIRQQLKFINTPADIESTIYYSWKQRVKRSVLA